MLFYEPDKRDTSVLPHDPFKAVIAPRPIGWVSTLSPDGMLNLAPYSFFNAVGERPAMLAPDRPLRLRGDYTVVERLFEMLRPG
jgi:hypothetical protein